MSGPGYNVDRLRRTALAAIALVVACAPAFTWRMPLIANEIDPNRGVEQAKEGLDDLSRYPWYNSGSDDVRPLKIKPDWSWSPKPEQQPVKLPKGGGFRTGTAPNFDFASWLVWGVIIALLAVIAYLLFKFYRARDEEASLPSRAGLDEAEPEQGQIEALPEPVRKRALDLLGEAQRLYGERRYAEAVLFLFSHQLLTLDRRHFIRLAKGKTNRQYMREVRQHGPLRALLEQTMVAFEDVFFGKHDLSQQRFEACWSQLGEFDKLVQKEAIA